MIKRNLIKCYQTAINLVKSVDIRSSAYLQDEKPIEDKDEKLKKQRKIPIFKGDYYFDFKNCLRYVYPYSIRMRAPYKKTWYGREISEVYLDEFSIFTPNNLNYMIKSGKVRVNDKIVEPTYKMKKRDNIISYIHRHENPVFASKIEIIKETDEILAINKPSSIPVHPISNYALNSVLGILSKEYAYKDLYTIHRLDRITSGVLIFAKNSKKASEFCQMIIARNVEKEYVCKVEGEFPASETVCTEKIDVLTRRPCLRFVKDSGKECLTKFKRLFTDGKTSIVHCKLITGRTHQIRVHLQFLGYPISNDPFYNSYAFGPNKGKGAEYHKLKSTQQIIEHIHEEHPTKKLHGNEIEFNLKIQDLEQSLAQGEFYDDVNFKLAEESRIVLLKNELFKAQINYLEATDKQIDEYIDNLVQCDSINVKIDLDYLRKNKHMKFNREKFDLNPTCEICNLYLKPPQTQDLSLYLHAMRYKIDGEIYFAQPPSWAKFSEDFDYSQSTF